jgi:transposase
MRWSKRASSHAYRAANPDHCPVKCDKRRYKRRNRIEIMFGRLKDWRRVATRYDRCPTVFFSALVLAATVLFWL